MSRGWALAATAVVLAACGTTSGPAPSTAGAAIPVTAANVATPANNDTVAAITPMPITGSGTPR